LLRDVADVAVGPAPKQGVTLRNLQETVSGTVIMLKGGNGKRVIEAIKAKIAKMRLPEGVRILPFYDQSLVIDGTIRTVETNLFEGFLLVTIVLLLFLGNVRAAIVTASVIPLSMLASFIGMRFFGISVNLMSLGAIDFGMIVDGAIVMMENSVQRLEVNGQEPTREAVRHAAKEVARPMVFGIAIIIAVYLPILFLQGLEGRMFRPMAITVCTALFGSLLLALTLIPTLASIIFRKGVRSKASTGRIYRWTEQLKDRYGRLLEWHLSRRTLTVSGAFLILAIALSSLFVIGTEFMPRLDEGSLLIETRKLPGISLTDSVEMSRRVEKALRAVPEIEDVVIKIGRPDFATEAMGINQGDTYVIPRPREAWKRFHTKEEFIERLDRELSQVPGIAYNFTQPMAMRMDETVSGVKSELAIKVFGDDFRTLDALANQVLRIVASVPGAANPQIELTSGVAELSVNVDRSAVARYGLNVTDVREAVEAGASGSTISEVIDGQKRHAIALRLPDRYRTDPDSVRQIAIRAADGAFVTLADLAKVEVKRGPEAINREEGQRRVVVMSDVRGRDLGSFVVEVQAKLSEHLQLPPGYFLEYGGQFANQARASRRLMVLIPAVLGIVIVLLYAMFASIRQSLLVVLNVPFALVGGIAALWIRQMNLNLSASVGFIALFGVAVLNGVVLVTSINQLRAQGLSIQAAINDGAKRRLRPVLMTALVASLGFVPMALATSTGAEIQRPLATVVIGGLFSSTILTLFLLPLFYGWFQGKEQA
jgi:heavy metal efflux system protein